MADPVFFDTGVLWSFAVAGALDDLGTAYGNRAMWTPAVQRETTHFAGQEPRLDAVVKCPWLTLHEFDPNDLQATADVERIRQTFGVSARRNQHRGEAESIVAAVALDGWFATEDYDAARRARNEGVRRSLMTTDALHDLVSLSVIDCARALSIYHGMQAEDRRVPPDLGPSDICW